MKKRIVSLIVLASMMAMTACGSAVETMSRSVNDKVVVSVKINIDKVTASVTASAKDCQASAVDTVARIAEEKAEAEALAAEEPVLSEEEMERIAMANTSRMPMGNLEDDQWLDLEKEMACPMNIFIYSTQDYDNQIEYMYADSDEVHIYCFAYGDFIKLFKWLDVRGYDSYQLITDECLDEDEFQAFKADMAEAVPLVAVNDPDLSWQQAQAEAQAAYLAQQQAAAEAAANSVPISGGKTMSREKYDAARAVAQSIADSIPAGESDLQRVRAAADAVKAYCDAATYCGEEDYNNAYGVFCKGVYTCAGSARAMGMVLECMGYSWEHVNPNQNTHQWVKLTMDGQVGWADGMGGIADYGECPFSWGGSYTDENGWVWTSGTSAQ